MFGQYYHGTIRKYIIAFGNLFNDIVIARLNAAGERIQAIQVPIAYGPKDKWMVRLKQDPNLEQNVGITLPRIGFEIMSLTYAPQRKLASTLQNAHLKDSDLNRLNTQYVPVPYDINILLSIFVKNADDGAQILEQILPYFRPEFTTNIRLIPEMNVVVDTPVVLQDVSIEDTYEGDFDTRRALVYNLNFSMKAYIYGPVFSQGVIKRAITNMFDDLPPNAGNKVEKITVSAAQYANGAPLMSPSANASLSVAFSSISANSDYGFSTNINQNPYDMENG
jgi:hypothetical protein|tara:strand:- start:3163 stop:3999 length:837 start_codon:yes stop_codon:yes gene_type:complete